MSSPLVVVAMLAWLTSGLAAVVVAPQNRAAQVLAVAGVGIAATVVLGPVLPSAPPAPSGTLLVELANASFFVAILAVTGLLVLHPRGVLERRWYARALAVPAGVAVVTLLGLSFVAPRVGVDGSGPDGLTHPNPLAVPAAAGLLPVVEVLWTSTLAWPLAGVLVFVDRWRRADRAGRRELAPFAAAMAVLALLLVAQLVVILAHVAVPEPGFAAVFQLGFTALPVVLLVGIARRTRALDADLAASRTRLITAEDRVRREIGRDLHDGVQQQLVAMLSFVQLAKRQHHRNRPQAAATLDELSGQVSGAISDLRELVSGIRPPVLADAGVAAALTSRLERLPADIVFETEPSTQSPAEPSTELPTEPAVPWESGPAPRWDDAVEAAVFFVGLEAVTNALKHAPGAQVRVIVVDTETELAVTVRDLGPGIGEDWARGRGLSGLQDRVGSLGGVFSVGAASGGGTVIRARFSR